MAAFEQQPDTNESWYADGLRFECTQCGNCCTGPTGYVWFSEEEGQAMADDLGLDYQTFRKQYARRLRGKWTLTETRTKHGYDCVFLDRATQPGKALCKVYKTRPIQCRTWPFWPENLHSQGSWLRSKRDTPCPGMESGKLYSVDEIRIIRQSQEDAD